MDSPTESTNSPPRIARPARSGAKPWTTSGSAIETHTGMRGSREENGSCITRLMRRRMGLLTGATHIQRVGAVRQGAEIAVDGGTLPTI